MKKGKEVINLDSTVERVVFRLKSSLSAVLSSFRYSHETHPESFRDSDTHDCLTLHFAKNANGRRAKSLKPILSTVVSRITFLTRYKSLAVIPAQAGI
jgi:hypothetical protein